MAQWVTPLLSNCSGMPYGWVCCLCRIPSRINLRDGKDDKPLEMQLTDLYDRESRSWHLANPQEAKLEGSDTWIKDS